MTTSAPELSVEQWVEVLNSKWKQLGHNSVGGFFDIGRDLIETKKYAVEAGIKWLTVIERLDFHRRVAQKFMRITKWADEIRLMSRIRALPPDYNTIVAIASLPHEVFEELIKNGTINPSVQRGEIAKILRLLRITEDEQRILALEPRPGKYRTLVVDPAWDYDWLSTGTRARIGYASQTIEQLQELDLKQWAESECHLYCWTTNNFMREACNLVQHWGFELKTAITWIKPPPFGMGNYFRNSTEHVIFATLGETKTRPAALSLPTHFFASRGEHSEKPEEFYEIVRAASYPPYGEGNQRKMRPDFTDLFTVGEKLVAAE